MSQHRSPCCRWFIAIALATCAAAADWRDLCDGKSLAGWTVRGGKATYAVENGEIVGRTAPGKTNTFLCTDEQFADFELEYEFKVDPKLNSGVQIRSHSFAAYNDGVVFGYQVEIDPSERGYTCGIYEEQRRGWIAKPPQPDEQRRKLFKQGEWNSVRVEAIGDTLRTWLNGERVVELRDGMTTRGFIGLQVHAVEGDQKLEVRWRKLRIRDLGDPTRRAPAGAIELISDRGDTSAWSPIDKPDQPIAWPLKDGVLEVAPGSGNLVTRRPFGDCRIHVEFAVDDNGKDGQANGNSGVYIQRRYEVQILNSAGQKPSDDNCGAIYKQKAADINCALPAGQWQTYDIDFRAARWDASGQKTGNARMSVWHNGTRIQDDVELPHQTGAGLAESPGDAPLMLQDHGNKIRFRNVWIAPKP